MTFTSIDLRAGQLDDPRVLAGLARDERCESLGRRRRSFGALRGEPLAHFRRVEDLHHLRVPFLHDVARRSGRREQAEPRRDVEAGNAGLGHRRQLRREFERSAVVTASARSLPAFTCGIALARLSNISCVSPASSACVAGAPPLNGTWTIAAAVSTLKSSPARWPALPVLPEPKLSLPGFAFAYAMNACADATGSEGLTTSTFGVVATSVIGAKSLTASYGMFGYRLGLTACVDSAPIRIV